MIVPMQKLTLLCLDVDVDSTLDALRDLGVVELRHVQSPEGEAVDKARQYNVAIQQALGALPKRAAADAAPDDRPVAEIVNEVVSLAGRQRGMRERLHALDAERARLEPYGSFDPADVRALARRGIAIRLYQVAGHEPISPAAGITVQELSRDKRNAYVVAYGAGDVHLDAEELELPSRSLDDVRRELDELATEKAALDARLATLAAARPRLLETDAEAAAQTTFLEARAGMGHDGRLAYLHGFCPVDGSDAVKAAAAKHGWAATFADADGEGVPTLIRNPAWVRPVKVVFDFIGISPGYREADISACFLLFFTLFFGMIVGDFGYGLIFLVLTIGARLALPSAPKVLFRFLLIMSCATIAWGLLTGNAFGLETLPAPLAAMTVDWLTDQRNIMFLCFLIGAVHLTIAHAWTVVRIRNSPQAIAQVGWILCTWAMFFLARAMVLGAPLRGQYGALLACGFVLVAVFMTPRRQLKTDWVNHIMLPLDLVANFVDVISYVRLFAVGMATFAVANAFNNMAVGDGIDGFFAGLVACLIIFVGHSLNILLAIMGVLVHGVRLNTLEFSGHMGMQWTGVRFVPFARAGAGPAE